MSKARLGDYAKFIRGITFKPAQKCDPRAEGAVACMRTKNVQTDLDEFDLIGVPRDIIKNIEKMLQEGDILVSSANSWNLVGRCCYVPHLNYPATAGGFISILRPTNGDLDPRYLYRWFSSDAVQSTVRLFGNQTTNISNLDHKRTLGLRIPLPPLAKQKRIVGILDAADALRAKRREALAQLDTLLQSTFLDMFGDPFDGEFDDKHVPFADLTKRITYGFTCPMSHLETGIPILTAKNVLDGTLDMDNVHYADQHEFDSLTDKSKPSPGDILITKDGSIGRCAVVPEEGPICINQSVALVIPKRSIVIPEYVSAYIRSFPVQQRIQRMGKGNALKHLQITELAKFPSVVPSLDLQRRFATIVELVERQKARMRTHLAELDALFASLQSRAFNGEL